MPLDIDRAKLYEEFLAAGLRRGERQRWYERKAEELGCCANTVKNIIASEKEAELLAAPDAKVTATQIVAAEIGADRVGAIQKLSDLLNAEFQVLVHDRDGNQVTSYNKPDFKTQLAAAKEILKIYGEVSDKLEVTLTRSDSLSDEDLERRIRDLKAKVDV